MMSDVESMKKDLTLQDIYQLIKKTSDEQTDKISKELNKKFNLISVSLDSIKSDIENLQKRQLASERIRRRNNIVIFGLRIATADLVSAVISQLKSLVEIDVQEQEINNIYYTGKKEGNERAIVVEFVSFLKKKSILKNAFKLKGTGVAISSDLCQEDRLKNRILVKHLKIAREQKLPARIKGDKLEVEGKFYTIEELEKPGDRQSDSGGETDDSISTGYTGGDEVGVDTITQVVRRKAPGLKQQDKKRKRNEKYSPPFLRTDKAKKK